MSTLFDLSGRTALVTGAGGGIGRRVAVGLAAAGADVSCVDLAAAHDGCAATASEVESLGRRAAVIDTDVTDSAAVDATVEQHERQLGPLRCAVNCAGIDDNAPAEAMSDDAWRRVLEIDLTGVFLCCRAEGRRMLAHGGGAIVNVASISGVVAPRGEQQANYNAAKAGVRHLTTTLAVEWATRGVRVNSLSPGYIETPLIVGDDWENEKARMVDATPMGRLGTPDELVGPTVFLLSDAATYVTGADLVADGGYSAW